MASFFGGVKPMEIWESKKWMVSMGASKKMGACDPKSRIFWDMFVESIWDIFLKSWLENQPFGELSLRFGMGMRSQ
jgi:hypothetical protein